MEKFLNNPSSAPPAGMAETVPPTSAAEWNATAVDQHDDIPLTHLKSHESGLISRITTSHDITLRLLELGVAPGEMVTFIRKAPMGDPIEVEILNYRLAIRKSEARHIFIHRI